MFKPIHTEQDYEEALEAVSTLVDLDPPKGSPEGDRLEVLATLLEAYERDSVSMALTDSTMTAAELLPVVEFTLRELSNADLLRTLGRQKMRRNRYVRETDQFSIKTMINADVLRATYSSYVVQGILQSLPPSIRAESKIVAAKAAMRGLTPFMSKPKFRKVSKLAVRRKHKLIGVLE